MLAALLPTQLSASVHEKATDDDPSSWGSVSHVGNQDGVPGSRIQQAH